jgi:hypothetical protein
VCVCACLLRRLSPTFSLWVVNCCAAMCARSSLLSPVSMCAVRCLAPCRSRRMLQQGGPQRPTTRRTRDCLQLHSTSSTTSYGVVGVSAQLLAASCARLAVVAAGYWQALSWEWGMACLAYCVSLTWRITWRITRTRSRTSELLVAYC